MANNYNLVHFIVGNAHLEPLVQSQVFEQAHLQILYDGLLKPRKVQVLYYCHYRDLLNGSNSEFLLEYRKKFPSIQIIPIYRGVRFSSYLKGIQLFFRLYSKYQVIIHCRGESAHKEIRTLPFLKFVKKRTVLDLRGIWSYERLHHKGVKNFSNITIEEQIIFNKDMSETINEVGFADGLSFVSENLHNLIAEQTEKLTDKRIIVPCVASGSNYKTISKMEPPTNSDFFTIVYVGTDKSYQHLGDLVFPFMKMLMKRDNRVRLKILSKDIQSILLKLQKLEVDINKVILKSVDRSEVFNNIKSSDLAILLREANVVNKVSSPVKLGEYLGCGLPVLFQKDSLGFCKEILHNDLGVEVDLREPENWHREVIKVLEFLESEKVQCSKERIKKFFTEKYCWESYIQTQRVFYKEILNN